MQRAEETVIGPVDTSPPFDGGVPHRPTPQPIAASSDVEMGSGDDSNSLSYFAKLADEE